LYRMRRQGMGVRACGSWLVWELSGGARVNGNPPDHPIKSQVTAEHARFSIAV